MCRRPNFSYYDRKSGRFFTKKSICPNFFRLRQKKMGGGPKCGGIIFLWGDLKKIRWGESPIPHFFRYKGNPDTKSFSIQSQHFLWNVKIWFLARDFCVWVRLRKIRKILWLDLSKLAEMTIFGPKWQFFTVLGPKRGNWDFLGGKFVGHFF